MTAAKVVSAESDRLELLPSTLRDLSGYWGVHCGCSYHGDHLGCEQRCADEGECGHPLGVSVVAETEALADACRGKPYDFPRPTLDYMGIGPGQASPL